MGNNMKKKGRIIALTIVCFSPSAFAGESTTMILGDERKAYQASDDDFNKMSRGIEYLNAKLLFIEAQKNVQTALADGTSDNSSTGNDFRRDGSIPRELRGREQGDRFLDARGNQITIKKSPTTYVSNISGMSGNLSAELIWGGNTLSIKRGDTLVGGTWEVLSVNRDDIVIKNRTKRIRIGKLPIDINSIVSE